MPGSSVIHVFPENNNSIRNLNSKVCVVHISKHPKLNFVPAKCDVHGSICYDSCTSSFNIHSLKVEQKYYIHVWMINKYAQAINLESFELQGIAIL